MLQSPGWEERPIRTVGETTVTTLGQRLVRPLRTCELWLVHGASGDGRVRLELGEQPVALGREAHAGGGWVLADPEVSRLHALLTREPGGGSWGLVDQGSRNGTFVDGRRVDRVTLQDGAVLRLGRCVLVFRDAPVETGPVEPEAPALPGPSREMQRVRGDVGRMAGTELPVLVVGAAGAARQAVAELLHARGGRSGAFVPVACGALAPAQAVAELFGEGGSSGGRLGQAKGGTLFLDEVEALPADAQLRLVRVLEARGGARVVCGALRPLEESVRAGAFRGDVLARLSGGVLRLAPLRTRREDVLPNARALLQRRASAPLLSADAAEALTLFGWPEDVRQLERVLEEARVRAASSAFLSCEHLAPEVAGPVLARIGADATPLLTRALSQPPAPAGPVRVEGLSPRVQQTLDCLLAGASEKEVAAQLGLSSHTVHDYVKKLYRHFGVSSRAELLATVLGRR